MEEKTLKRLEYYKVLEKLASFAGSLLGKEQALALRPVDDPVVIHRWQEEVNEGRKLLRFEPTAELGGWKDIRNPLLRAGRGAVLEPEELVAVSDTITAGRIIKKFLHERQESYVLLNELVFFIIPLPDLEARIKKTVLPGGEIADNASPELARTRKKLVGAQLDKKIP
jgi:DNA mismatch repair protein MutS2